ncbi:MAG: hypothetical protein JRJ29_00380 [Deltaproteobacteria bacterium]|nr:hypothetical protein [Deltaproteobacteria bacterium]MBW2081623.1 hypothetical protein [Deltaproteobacteria bacterium]
MEALGAIEDAIAKLTPVHPGATVDVVINGCSVRFTLTSEWLDGRMTSLVMVAENQ